MTHTHTLDGRRMRVAPLLVLGVVAAIIAGLMMPATAGGTHTAGAEFTGAPDSLEPGAPLGDVVIDVTGSIQVDIADLPADIETPTASLSLITPGEGEEDDVTVPDALIEIGDDGSEAEDVLVDSGTATFTDLRLADDLPVGDYELQVVVILEGFFEITATSPLTITEPNEPPVAAFSVSCEGLTCTFHDESTDDVRVASWAWDFGDAKESTSDKQSPSFTYPEAGTYTVTLTVTDDGGKTATATADVEVFTFSEDCTNGCTFEFKSDKIDYSVSGPARNGASAGVTIDAFDQEFVDACNGLEAANPDLRILPTIIQVVPAGFASGDVFTVRVVIPKSVINQDVNRSDKPWTVCFLDEPAEHQPEGSLKGTTRLLELCELTGDEACLVSRTKFRGGQLEVIFQFPAVDPYFR